MSFVGMYLFLLNMCVYEISGSQGMYTFNILGYCPTVFQSSSTILLDHQLEDSGHSYPHHGPVLTQL